LLERFRLLEAAGAATLIGEAQIKPCLPAKPPEWWALLADSARTYRSAIFRTLDEGFSAIEDWSQLGGSGIDADLECEKARLCAEYRRWLCEVPGGHAYLAWLSAYVAVAEIDGERALRSLDRCATIVQEFADVPEVYSESSVYGFLQSAADAVALALHLPEHPLRDARRFAFLPPALGTG
jgi:hypothetical protein